MINRLKRRFDQYVDERPNVVIFIEKAKSWSPPGFYKIPIYEVILFIINEWKKDKLITRSKAIAFSLFLALFPAIIFLFTLLPLFTFVQDYTDALSDQFKEVIPTSAHTYIFSIINDLTSIKRGGLQSLGVVLALFFSSNGMMTLMSGFDKSYVGAFLPRVWWKKRLIAIVLTIILFFLLIISILVIVISDKVLDQLNVWIQMPNFLLNLLLNVKWLVSILLVYSGFSAIYKFGPSTFYNVPFINVGSILATIASLATSSGFSYFINSFGRYNEIYGSLGALIITMIWFQLNSMILLLGFEINAGLMVKAYMRRTQRLQN